MPLSRSTRIKPGKPMTGAEYSAALKKLGMSQVGAASYFGVADSTGRRWVRHGPPLAVAYVLRGTKIGEQSN
jgi:transposase